MRPLRAVRGEVAVIQSTIVIGCKILSDVHISREGERGPRAPSGFFVATCFINFFKVSILIFCQVTGSNDVPWGSFLAFIKNK